MGDAFNFLIRVRCSWCVQATATAEKRDERTQQIRTFIADNRPAILERVEDTIRPLARTFPPYRAAEAEDEINKGLTGCLSDGDVRVTVVARVDVCEPVREDLQKAWRERLLLDCNGDFRQRHVEVLKELQESWRELLIEGLEGVGEVQAAKTGWIAPYALALAQDPEQSAAVYLRPWSIVGSATPRSCSPGSSRPGRGREDGRDRVRVPQRLRASCASSAFWACPSGEDRQTAAGFQGGADA